MGSISGQGGKVSHGFHCSQKTPFFLPFFSAILGLREQLTPAFELSSLPLISCELPYSSKCWRPPPGQLAAAGASTLTCLWASISTVTTWLWRMWGTFPANWLRGKRQGAQRLLKMQNRRDYGPLPGQAEAVSRRVWKNPGRSGSCRSQAEDPEPGRFGSAWPGFRPPGPYRGDFLESPSYLSRGSASRCRPPDEPSQAGWSPGRPGRVSLWKAYPQAPTRKEPLEPSDLWKTLWCQGFCLKILSVTTMQLFFVFFFFQQPWSPFWTLEPNRNNNNFYSKNNKNYTVNLRDYVLRDFPGGPVVKNLASNAGDAGSIPGQKTKIPGCWGTANLLPKPTCRKLLSRLALKPLHHN